MNSVDGRRSTLREHLPWILAAVAILLAGRSLKRLAWRLFGLGWVFYWTGGLHWMRHLW